MLDRSKCKKMLVWDDDRIGAGERIVIDVFPDGSCIAVDLGYEESFYAGGEYEIDIWDHYKETPEKTKRWMTHDKIFAMIQEQLKKGVLVFFDDGCGFITTNYNSAMNEKVFRYSLDLGKTWHKLEVEE